MEKNDKLMYDYIPEDSLELLATVYANGAVKYEPDDWKVNVKENMRGYVSALFRHLQEHRKGVIVDEESGLPPLVHLAATALMIDWVTRHENTYLTKEQVENMQWPESTKYILVKDIREVNEINKIKVTPTKSSGEVLNERRKKAHDTLGQFMSKSTIGDMLGACVPEEHLTNQKEGVIIPDEKVPFSGIDQMYDEPEEIEQFHPVDSQDGYDCYADYIEDHGYSKGDRAMDLDGNEGYISSLSGDSIIWFVRDGEEGDVGDLLFRNDLRRKINND